MLRRSRPPALAVVLAVAALPAQATILNLGACKGAVACVITENPPNPVKPNPNDGVLLAWDEKQNVTLTEDLPVDRVFDANGDVIEPTSAGSTIRAGTVVSSHYVQWDPKHGGSPTVETTIETDGTIFAFITTDRGLFDSDALLGLDGIDYSDFRNRGLEPETTGDVTEFDGPRVRIKWTANSPGDWARLISARSPVAASR